MSQYYLLCRDNDQENGSRFLSPQSNLCRDKRGCKVKDLCRDKGNFFCDRKWKSNETSQDKVCCDKDFNATKIKERNIS